MTIRDYLRAHAREDLPEWLARHRPGDRFDRSAFFGSHVVFYPGAGTDGHPVALFGSTHSAHCFVYADYGHGRHRWEQELTPGGQPFSGYTTLDRLSLKMADLTPGVGDEHGPSRLAILFLGADGIASYDALFFMPRRLLVARDTEPWAGFVRVAGIGGDPGGMHGRLRYLHERAS
jgi:hypothetical protein